MTAALSAATACSSRQDQVIKRSSLWCRLADFKPMTDYDKELVYGTFSAADACNFGVHVYPEEGDRLIVSIVVDAGSHGTHVAGITSAHHEDNTAMNGIAPGKPCFCSRRHAAGQRHLHTGLQR